MAPHRTCCPHQDADHCAGHAGPSLQTARWLPASQVAHMSDPDLSQHAPVPTGSATHGFQATKTSLPHKTMQKLCQ
jgi:hypothetical protein